MDPGDSISIEQIAKLAITVIIGLVVIAGTAFAILVLPPYPLVNPDPYST
jgi:hypothetical protein